MTDVAITCSCQASIAVSGEPHHWRTAVKEFRTDHAGCISAPPPNRTPPRPGLSEHDMGVLRDELSAAFVERFGWLQQTAGTGACTILPDHMETLRTLVATSSRDWSLADGDARIYGLTIGWDRATAVSLGERYGWSTQFISATISCDEAFGGDE